MKAFIYCRQSVASDQEESLSIKMQVEECSQLAKNKGYEIVDIFKEQDVSGRLYPTGAEALAAADKAYQAWTAETKKTGQWRDKLGEMLKRLDEVQAVLCYDLTRLHRSLRGSFLENFITQALSSSKVKLVTVKEGEVDFSRFADSLVSTLTSQINSEQLNIMREKSRASMKSLFDRGEWSTACFKSFGYKTTGRKREVEIDEPKAEIVRTIFKMYIEGATYWFISKKINPIMWEKYHTTVHKAECFRILRNPIYCGYYRSKTGELIKSKPNEGKEIIDFATWKKAQEIYEHRQKHPRTGSRNWLPLSGKVFCGVCGEPMRAVRSNVRFMQYRCHSYIKHGLPKAASCKNGLTWVLEGADLDEGDTLSKALMGLLALWHIHRREEAKAVAARSTEIETAEVSAMSIQSKMKTIAASFMDGLIDESLYQSSIAQMSKRLKEERAKIDELKRAADSEAYTADEMLTDINALSRGELGDREMNEAFSWVFKRVTIHKDRVECDTPLGKVTLPVVALGRKHIKMLPFHFILADKDSCDIVYTWRFREPQDEADIIGYEKEGKLLAELGRCRIWLL